MGSSAIGRSSRPGLAVVVALLVIAGAQPCDGFAWQQVSRSAVRGKRMSDTPHQHHQAKLAGALPRRRDGVLFSSAPTEVVDGDVSGAAVASATVEANDKVRRKVVKPWPTKAQETVNYSNVEAM